MNEGAGSSDINLNSLNTGDDGTGTNYNSLSNLGGDGNLGGNNDNLTEDGTSNDFFEAELQKLKVEWEWAWIFQ